MTVPQTVALINSWETVRFELLNTRVCDLKLKIEGSPVEPLIAKVCRELEGKRIAFRPRFYLTDSWGCPNEVPAVGIPFHLADKRLSRVEEEQTGEIQDDASILMFLRHEVGHAINYAYRLWMDPRWAKVFGQFDKPYHDTFYPNPRSREFVRHIEHSQYGRNYAQKHPDEDFAETFAVWLTPRSAWRRKYRSWPALEKLKCVDALMHRVRGRKPRRVSGTLMEPVGKITMLLAEYYGQRVERYRSAAQGYVDDRLRSVFPPARTKTTLPATELIRRERERLQELIAEWAGLEAEEAQGILGKIESRVEALALDYSQKDTARKLIEIGAMVMSLAMDFAYTGRFIN